jgi:hypothetical protein
MEPDLKLAVDVLLAPVCQCGRAKRTAQAVCLRCWNRLPAHAQHALYARVESGFGEAYGNACDFLRGGPSPAMERAKAEPPPSQQRLDF